MSILLFLCWLILASYNFGFSVIIFPMVLISFVNDMILKFWPKIKDEFEKSFIYYIGLMVSINPWFWLIGLPVVLVGLVKVLAVKTNSWMKIKLIIIPLIVYLIMSYGFYHLVMLKKSF